MLRYLVCYLLFINLLALMLMGVDKHRAKRHRWRIPERTLLLTAVLGGSIGGIAGMLLFRHKTKHAKFYIGLPVILGVQIVCAVIILTANP